MDAQLYRGINVKAFLVRTLKDIWQTQFFYRCAIKSNPLAKWCTIIPLPAIFRLENAGYLRLFHPFLNDILHPYIKSYTLSYTLSYTRKCQSVKYFSMPGVGNVGFFQKLFLGKMAKHLRRTGRKTQNIGLLWAKVRMFCIESTDVCLKEVRCFCFPEAPFLKFPRYQEDRNTVFFFLLRESQTSLNSEEK